MCIMSNTGEPVRFAAFACIHGGHGRYRYLRAAGDSPVAFPIISSSSISSAIMIWAGFVLAMTTVATYSSVSSFVGGPGMAWQIGFGWIYMAVVQVTAIFLVLGIFGKRVALLSRKFDAVTVVDIIRERFQSDALASMAAFIIVLFFCATMTAQFVGGAKLFRDGYGATAMRWACCCSGWWSSSIRPSAVSGRLHSRIPAAPS
jgi:hypothetical protein